MTFRIKVACINWSHPLAPHALTYVLMGGSMVLERYFATWAEAMEYAQTLAARKAPTH